MKPPCVTSRRISFVLALLATIVSGCVVLTEPPPAGDDFESPLPGLSPELAALFAAGDENFERTFAISEGLGPLFVERSCASCHFADGRGTPEKVLTRFSRGFDLAETEGGDQLQPRSIPGVPPEVLPAGVDVSIRVPPPVFGRGLMEAIPDATILALADEFDADGDGISGKANFVVTPDYVPPGEIGGGAGPQLGRFGLKANRASLLDQVVHAYHQDMGITSDFLPEENLHAQQGGVTIGDLVADPEITGANLQETVVYVRLLAPPDRGANNAQGETLFSDIGCADCHVPMMMTGDHPIPQLSNQEVHLYSDMLLHDMGPGLADGRPDGLADGQEWRTPPLWGLRLVRDFLDGQEFYLHDGRATNLTDAILAHGGEATDARTAFNNLSPSEQEAVLAFLRSL